MAVDKGGGGRAEGNCLHRKRIYMMIYYEHHTILPIPLIVSPLYKGAIHRMEHTFDSTKFGVSLMPGKIVSVFYEVD